MPDDRIDTRWVVSGGSESGDDAAEGQCGFLLDSAVAITNPDTVGGEVGHVGPFAPHGGVIWPFKDSKEGERGATAAYADAFLAYYSEGKVYAVSQQGDISKSLKPLEWGELEGDGVEITPLVANEAAPGDGTRGLVVRGARWGRVDNLIFVPIENADILSDWFDGSRKTNSTTVADHDGKSPSPRRRAGIEGSLVVQDSFTEKGPAVVLNGEGAGGPAPRHQETTEGETDPPFLILRPGTTEYTAYMYKKQQRSRETTPPKSLGGGKGLRFWDGTGVGHMMDVLAADADSCVNHYLGTQKGVREVSGHIRTDAPFKIPGSSRYDFPIAFSTIKWERSGMKGRFQTAQIRPDIGGKTWRIQYAVPNTKPGKPLPTDDTPEDDLPVIDIPPPYIPPNIPEEPQQPPGQPPGDPKRPPSDTPSVPGDPEFPELPVHEDEQSQQEQNEAESVQEDGGAGGDDGEVSHEQIAIGLLYAQLGILNDAWKNGFFENREDYVNQRKEILDQIQALQEQEQGRQQEEAEVNGVPESQMNRATSYNMNATGGPQWTGLPLPVIDLVDGDARVETYDPKRETDYDDPGFRDVLNTSPRGIHHQWMYKQNDDGTPVIDATPNPLADIDPRAIGEVTEAVLPPDKDLHRASGKDGVIALDEASNYTQNIWYDAAISQYFGGHPSQVSNQTAIVGGERLYNDGATTQIRSYDDSGNLTARDVLIGTALAVQNRFTLATATSAQTVASGAINTAATQSALVDITSETGTSDTVTTINGGGQGQVLGVRSASGHTITFAGGGNISLPAGNITNTRTSWQFFVYDTTTTNWMPVCC